MKLIIFAGFVLVAIIVLLLIRKYSSLEFVSHARLLFKAWSVWLATLGTVLGAYVQSFPDAALQAWAILPPDIKSYLPPNILGFISQAMIVLAVLSQFVRQTKLKDQADSMRNSQ
ncbi:hypothetical protein ACJ42O_017085 [Klebsiella pneumoniae]|uniref:DUF7940 domain-containing protein n=1 Tax=Klebsiella pneumoniae TaxID=573 RepID=UPI00388FE785